MTDQRVLFLGAGSAGIGIANMITSAMMLEGDTEEQAISKINLFDVNGLLENSRTDLSEVQKRFAKDQTPTKNFVEAINQLKPTIIIGVSTVGKAFTQEVVEAMSTLNERPIIFALSNPTEHAECSAEKAYKWSNGKAVFCAGVPFDPVELNGVSLAIYATQPKLMGDAHWITSGLALAKMLTQEEKEKGMVLPPQSDILEVSLEVATKVAERFFEDGLAQVERPDNIKEWIKAMQYTPKYQSF
ncbi:unnamed protein product [Cyprideis torosa]|uniref:Uncharacterized protein n=1 Tax=Cyprideis torosa TaxID=163714 RepID=A0A7R8WPN4_9CRUS|nr:unnamed protein product [Cyprideis torosa]CAG0907370.1 unnamed protein product [Cyprideis torosa]